MKKPKLTPGQRYYIELVTDATAMLTLLLIYLAFMWGLRLIAFPTLNTQPPTP